MSKWGLSGVYQPRKALLRGEIQHETAVIFQRDSGLSGSDPISVTSRAEVTAPGQGVWRYFFVGLSDVLERAGSGERGCLQCRCPYCDLDMIFLTAGVNTGDRMAKNRETIGVVLTYEVGG
mgnify:CR=1 FL=1